VRSYPLQRQDILYYDRAYIPGGELNLFALNAFEHPTTIPQWLHHNLSIHLTGGSLRLYGGILIHLRWFVRVPPFIDGFH
jgi:hypothetical protein